MHAVMHLVKLFADITHAEPVKYKYTYIYIWNIHAAEIPPTIKESKNSLLCTFSGCQKKVAIHALKCVIVLR